MVSRNYVIAGGSTGIGRLIMQSLVAEGHNVTHLSRHMDPGLAEGLVSDHRVDLGKPGELPELPEEIHGLVYAPGTIRLKPFRSLSDEDFMEDLQVNLFGAVRLLRHAEKSLKKGEASVILFSTVAVQQGMPFHASIAAAKGAVEGLVRALAAEWAPKIRVNAIAPSLTNTPLAEKLLSSPEKVEANGARHPLKRVGEPGDIARMALFLLAPENNWISGQVIGIDGGLSSLRT